MILCDISIRGIIHDILPGEANPLINPASIDLTLGAYIKKENPNEISPFWVDEVIRDLPEYSLRPQELILVSTFEVVVIPPNLAGEVRLKSSRAREGFQMGNAGYVDPGWRGVLTFQITNAFKSSRNLIFFREPFFQLILHQLDAPASHPYRGRYQGAKRVEGVKK